MFSARYTKFLCSIALFLMVASCGDLPAGTMGTVKLTSNPKQIDLDSSVATHSVTDPLKRCTAEDSIVIPAADKITVAVSSKSTTATSPSNAYIRNIVVKYTPVHDPTTNSVGPALSDKSYNDINLLLTAGGTLDLPVIVAPQEYKGYLLTSLACTGRIYLYNVQIRIYAEEDKSGESTTLSNSVNIRFSDFVE